MLDFRNPGLLLGLIILVALVTPAAAFGAGNIASISKVEGQNWRHGDIEDALLTLAMARAMKHKKFNKIMVSRVYFGNWLRDYSQAIDVGTVKSVSAEAIRLLLSVLGFLTFGYGSGEFEITADRLGCYRPEDHIDNPKNYADNQDARQYDRRLRGPVDEERELAVDPETGMKNYIANERAGIMTSAKHVRKLFSGCIELGRRYKDRGNKEDLYESLRLMGTGLHCLEDFFAHSNYTELALIEMGERDVFPHVGRDCRIRLEGARGDVHPIVTGTFGGVDFLHSVVGEVSDKMTQNEIEELEGTLQDSKTADTSLLRDLLDKIPDGLFGNKNQSSRIDEIQSNANAAQMQNTSVSPRNPEEFTVYVRNIYQQIMPAIQFHDDVMKSITSAVEKIPVLPKIIEQLEEQLSKFVFSIIAPFVVPLIQQIRNELRTGSEEIVHSSEQEQHIVFNNDRCDDPTHSMLSKDHFSNILNEIAGRTAARMLHWVVPQLMDAIDDDNTDVNRLLDRIVNGVMHHPAQKDMGRDGVSEARNIIFDQVKEWWNQMGDDQRNDYRRKLSREGVQRGENHKEGVYDTGHGHGCCGKLQMRKLYGEPDTLEGKIAGAAADAIFQGATGAISGLVEQNTGFKLPSTQGSQQEQRQEEGGLGGFLSAAGSILGGAFGKDETEKHSSQRREDDGSYTQTETEYGRHGNRYGQAQYTETQRPDGSSQSQYSRFEQQDSYGGRQTSGYGYEETTESRPTYGGGYEQRTERHEYKSSNADSYGGGRTGGHASEYSRQDNDSYGRRQESSGYGREESGYASGYGRQDKDSYGGGNRRRDDDSYGSGYGGGNRRDEDSYGGGGRRRDDDSYGGGGGYKGREDSGYGDEYGRREEGGYRGSEGRGGYAAEYERGGDDDDNESGRRRQHHGRREEGGYGGGGYGGGY
ncbi:hypothetical protein JDV02_009199 [Purpureocillium takamizusanense]|uniref:NIMA-interacting protein TinC n=1 Tax=Purpureocillium takamizusanense TaxID=2060973 RepID=A0A9Q8VE09_9HYPO|nr:uncharacterized protein JDV02_009199 [Purpureocillium takamizusanense]UNI23375.1 hypothetical protein JDV02_009199 [Purpureocillium takamizusanense]